MTWPGITLLLVALGHFGLGARVYGRVGGRLPRWRRGLMAWDCCFHEISRRYYEWRAPAWSELTSHIWFGGWPNATTTRRLLDAGVTAIVDLSTEFDCSSLARARRVNCLFLDLLDLSVPSLHDMRRAAAFITEESRRGIVYIHCKAGYFRSAAIAGAWLIASGRAKGADAAVRLLEAARPGLRVCAPIREALGAFAREKITLRPNTSRPEPHVADTSRLVWMLDIQRNDPALFDLMFGIQDHVYRLNRSTRGLVWSYEAFCARAAGYAVFGSLPDRKADGSYPSPNEALASGTGFVLARPLPEGGPFLCLKLSIVAGNHLGAAAACRQAMRFGLPVIAAIESRLAAAASRIGFEILPASASRLLGPLFAPAFVQAPWEFRGIGPEGQVVVVHPDFRDPLSGQLVRYEKTVIHSPKVFLQLLRMSSLATMFVLIARNVSRRLVSLHKENLGGRSVSR